jgi:hypothetical protein
MSAPCSAAWWTLPSEATARNGRNLAARALAILPLYRPVPRIPVYQVNVDGFVDQAAEHDAAGALLDLITTVLALGEELLAQPAR